MSRHRGRIAVALTTATFSLTTAIQAHAQEAYPLADASSLWSIIYNPVTEPLILLSAAPLGLLFIFVSGLLGIPF